MNNLKSKIKSFQDSPYLTTVFRIFLGLVFLYASFNKILNPGSFAIAIQNYQLIPMSLSNMVAIFLPWCEFYCAGLLLFGWWHKPAALLVSIMSIIFIVALTLAYLRGLDIDCGCYGTGSSVSIQKIIENFILLALSLHVFFNPKTWLAIENINKRQNNSTSQTTQKPA